MIVVIGGKLMKDGEPWVPAMGDPEALRALSASRRAQELKVGLTSGMDGKGVHHVSLGISCPYCGERFHGKGSSRVARDARREAEERLFPGGERECECGAIYGEKDGVNCKQTNL